MLITAYNASLSLNISQSYTLIEVPEQESLPEESTSVPVEPVSTEDEGEQKLRGENGVLRLLQEGHFKGNAEMRLREIFHRELSILGVIPTQEQVPNPSSVEEGDLPEIEEE